MVWYGPNEVDGEEMDRFCSDIDRSLDRVKNEYRLFILGNLNGWIEDRTRDGVTGAFGVPGENDNGGRVEEFYAERGLCVGSTYIKHMSLHKYTRAAKCQNGVEVKSMINPVVVKKDMLHYCGM